MILETILLDGEPTLAAVANGGHVPVGGTLFERLQAWDAEWPEIRAAAERGKVVRGAKVLPQFTQTRKVICAGANYYKHLVEMDVSFEKTPGKPAFYFLKPPTALATPGKTLPLDPTIKMLDWEVEMVAIIGRAGRDIALADALTHVAGYTVAVDVTARDRLFNPDSIFKFDFLNGKGRDGYCPIGNGFVPAETFGDPQAAHLKLAVNGVTKQDSSTSDMIYSVAELVMWASKMFTLEPGDVLLTGSPAGVGMPRKEFLHAGDVMHVELAPASAQREHESVGFDVEVFTP